MNRRVWALWLCLITLCGCGERKTAAPPPIRSEHVQVSPTPQPDIPAPRPDEQARPPETAPAGAPSVAADAPLEEEPPETPPAQPPVPAAASLSVLGASGETLLSCEIPWIADMSVFDALMSAAQSAQIKISYTGKNKSAYVKGIDGLSAFDYGGMSGWLYYVNGVKPGVGCGAYQLSAGDQVIWKYTVDFTKEPEVIGEETAAPE